MVFLLFFCLLVSKDIGLIVFKILPAVGVEDTSPPLILVNGTAGTVVLDLPPAKIDIKNGLIVSSPVEVVAAATPPTGITTSSSELVAGTEVAASETVFCKTPLLLLSAESSKVVPGQ